MTPFFENEYVSLFCAYVREVELVGAVGVVTSPPYNVGLDYDGGPDVLPWVEYWRLAEHTGRLICRSGDAGRPSVGQHRGGGTRGHRGR